MAPVLFLFLMTAVQDLLDQAWDREGIERVTLEQPSDETFSTGEITILAGTGTTLDTL